jgi:hypothetical protein
MPTAAEAFNALPATSRIALYGLHLYEIVSQSVFVQESAPANKSAVFVRLSTSLGWSQCKSLSHAQELHQGYLERWIHEGLPLRDLASSFGYVADQESRITHWLSPSGNVCELRQLGIGDMPEREPARPLFLYRAICTREMDEQTNGSPYFSTDADEWLANETPVAGAQGWRAT